MSQPDKINEPVALAILGVAGLVGSFVIGKSAIEGIQHARLQAQMHGPKQQIKTTKFDDFMKFAGIAMSLYTMFTQAPEMIEKIRLELGE